MAIVQPVNNKTNTIEVSNEATDLLSGAPIAFGALTTPLPGFPAIVRGVTAGAFVGKFRLGDVIYARDTGRLWLYLADNLGAPVLVLITEGSINGNAVGQGPDIVLVVADKAGKYAPFSMSSAVYSTIPAALAAVPAGGATIILLDDGYTLGASLALPVATHVAFTGLGYGGLTQQKVVIVGPAAQPLLSNAGNTSVSFTNVRLQDGGGKIWEASAFACAVYAQNSNFSGELDFATNGATAILNFDSSIASLIRVSDDVPSQLIDIKNGSEITSLVAVSSGGAGAVTVNSVDSRLVSVVGVVAVGPFDIDCQGGVVSTFTNVLRYRLRNTVVTGTTLTSVSDGSIFGLVNLLPGITTLTCGGNLALRDSYLLDTTLVTTVTGTLTQENGVLLGTATAATFNGSGGRVNAITVTTQSTTRSMRFSGATSLTNMTDAFSVFESTLGLPTTARLTKSRHAGQITLGAVDVVSFEHAYINVTGLAAGQGAIVDAGAPLILSECFVRGEQAAPGTNFAVSGTGSVNIAGALGGGCFLANTLTIVTSFSKGLATRHVDVAMAANTTMLAESVGDVVDAFRVTPTASGFNIELYDPSTLPVGFEVAVKNVDYVGAFGFNVVPAAGDTLDNLATGITLGQNNVARFRVVSASAWETF